MFFIGYAASSFWGFAVEGFEEAGLEVVDGLDDVTDGLEETVPGLDEVPLGLEELTLGWGVEEGGEEVTVSSDLLDTGS